MRLVIKNFRCYDHEEVDLGTDGTILLSGKSGSGKSSILMAINFCLYGEDRNNRFLTKIGKKGCCVELFDSTRSIYIKRVKSPRSLLVERGDSLTEPQRYHDDEAEAVIKDIFGAKFRICSYMEQNNFNSFISMSPTDKMKFLESVILGSHGIEALKGLVKDDIKKLCLESKNKTIEAESRKKVLELLPDLEVMGRPMKTTKTDQEVLEVLGKNLIVLEKREASTLEKLRVLMSSATSLGRDIEIKERYSESLIELEMDLSREVEDFRREFENSDMEDVLESLRVELRRDQDLEKYNSLCEEMKFLVLDPTLENFETEYSFREDIQSEILVLKDRIALGEVELKRREKDVDKNREKLKMKEKYRYCEDIDLSSQGDRLKKLEKSRITRRLREKLILIEEKIKVFVEEEEGGGDLESLIKSSSEELVSVEKKNDFYNRAFDLQESEEFKETDGDLLYDVLLNSKQEMRRILEDVKVRKNREILLKCPWCKKGIDFSNGEVHRVFDESEEHGDGGDEVSSIDSSNIISESWTPLFIDLLEKILDEYPHDVSLQNFDQEEAIERIDILKDKNKALRKLREEKERVLYRLQEERGDENEDEEMSEENEDEEMSEEELNREISNLEKKIEKISTDKRLLESLEGFTEEGLNILIERMTKDEKKLEEDREDLSWLEDHLDDFENFRKNEKIRERRDILKERMKKLDISDFDSETKTRGVEEIQTKMRLVEKKIANRKRLDDKIATIRSNIKEIGDPEFEKDIVDNKITDCRKTLAECKEKISSTTKKIENMRLYIKYLEEQRKREDILRGVIDVEEIVAEIDRNITDHEKYLTLIELAESKCISQIVDEINYIANEYLEAFFDGNVLVSLDLLKENKKGIVSSINYTIQKGDTSFNQITYLSGGETARVTMAFTLALSEIFDTPFVMLDETTSSLDEEIGSEVFSYIKSRLSQKLVIIVAHQVTKGVFDRIHVVGRSERVVEE